MAGSSTLPTVQHGYRRAILMAAVLAVVAFVVAAVVGHPAAGGLIFLGFCLGAWNANRVRETQPSLVDGEKINRRAVGVSGVRRLGWVTLVVVVCAVAFRPEGWTVVLGLAAFQLLLVANTLGPLVREVRRS